MEQFRIRPDGFKEIRKQLLVRSIPIAIVAGAVGIGISLFNFNYQNSQADVLPFVIPVAFGAVAFGLFRGVNRQKLLFDSYLLTISDNEVIREQTNTPTIKLPFSDIKEIIKNANGSFTIKGRTTLDVIGVPTQIGNYSQLEESLNRLKPLVTKTQGAFSQRLTFPITLVTLALMATVYVATNKIAVGFSGTMVSGFLIWSFVQTQRNKNIDNKTKRGRYWTILVLFSIVSVTVYKLFVY